MKRFGVATLIAGGVVTLAGSFLKYLDGESLWQLTTRYPVIVAVLAVIAMVLALSSLGADRWILPALAIAISAFLLGENFPVDLTSYHYKVGFWLLAVGSLIMTAGGIAATAGAVEARLRTERTLGIDAAAAATPSPVTARRQNGDTTGAPAATAVAGSKVLAGVGGRGSVANGPEPSAAALPPAGWYPDPAHSAKERYWSGEAWTQDVRD